MIRDGSCGRLASLVATTQSVGIRANNLNCCARTAMAAFGRGLRTTRTVARSDKLDTVIRTAVTLRRTVSNLRMVLPIPNGCCHFGRPARSTCVLDSSCDRGGGHLTVKSGGMDSVFCCNGSKTLLSCTGKYCLPGTILGNS